MEQIREGSNLARHFLENCARLRKSASRSLVEGCRGLRDLGQVQIHCQHALRQTIVELAAQSPPFFILQPKQARGKLVQRFLDSLAFGDVSKGSDHPSYGTVSIKLRHSIRQTPEKFA